MGPEPQLDFPSLLTDLRERGVRFLVFGRQAMRALGSPVFTQDYDLWFESSSRDAVLGFFEQELGAGFRFNALVRQQIREAGSTLGEIAEAYVAQQKSGEKRAIEPQFEYNRFVREYRKKNPRATHRQVSESWMAWRSLPYSDRPPIG